VQRPLQITIRDLASSPAIEDYIRKRVGKLELFYPRVMGCHVVVEIPHRHKHQGKHFNVRIDLKVPEAELAQRKGAWKPPVEVPTRGYAKLYMEHVLQAEHGCDFDFLRKA